MGTIPGQSLIFTGLTSGEARARLLAEGPNQLPGAESRRLWRVIADVLREPMLSLLLAGGLVYLLLGSAVEAAVLLAFATFSILVTTIQERRTERVLEALGDLAAPSAMVLRDGEALRIASRDIVRGDALLLNPGDRVAADAELVSASDLEADESLLTGESLPVRKVARTWDSGPVRLPAPGGDGQPFVYSGTLVIKGNGIAEVTGTASRTFVGQIGRSLAGVQVETPKLRRETARVIRLCAIGGGCIAFLVVLLNWSLRGGWLDAILAGIAVGMALLPEEFPVVLTIFFAMGAWRIAKAGVLTRRASSIETLGAATVLCTDKTGTLTQNRMGVAELWLPTGDRWSLAEHAAIPGTFRELLATSRLASATAPVDPMEIAFHEAAERAGAQLDHGELVHQFSLRPELLAMSNAWRVPGSADLLLAGKGAPEAISQLCGLDQTQHGRLIQATNSMSSQGMRVLAVGAARAEEGRLGLDHADHTFVLLGLIGLSDPIRPGVGRAIGECRAAGVQVVMITGDYPQTASAIASQAGIAAGELITGSELVGMSDEVLASRITQATVFARIMPDQKLRIVRAFQHANQVVAMIGDGVNDAPALKAADIGIAMGKRGTDVAREAASIVLVEDDFTAIVQALRLGRHIYDNLRKAISFIFAVHVPIAGLAILPLVAGMPVLFGPIQIALLEMIIDPVCALVFEAEEEESDLMNRPPRPPSARLISTELIVRSIGQGALALAIVAGLFIVGHRSGLPEPELRSLSFFSLVAAVLALAVATRKQGRSLRRAVALDNRALAVVLGAVAIVSGMILFVSPLATLLQFGPLSAIGAAAALGSAILLLVLLEQSKRALPA
jgi:P-type Ca2+ transporter type 2C